MWPYFSRHHLLCFIFLLLAIFAFVHNFYQLVTFNTAGLKWLNADNESQSSLQTATIRRKLYCGYEHQVLSKTEQEEEESLFDALQWPKPPENKIPFMRSSDASHSNFVILNANKHFKVGDQLEVIVHMKDYKGRPKQYGGDYLQSRIYSAHLKAGAIGRVVDHQNGSYRIFFTLLWPGKVTVSVTLVHPSEGIQLLQRLREEKPNKAYFKSLFKFENNSKVTICNVCLPGDMPVCNFTDANTGEPWFCYKPRKLPCGSRVNHFKGGYQKNLLTFKERYFFQSGVNIKVPISANGSDTVTVRPSRLTEVESLERSHSLEVFPSGYYYQDKWQQRTQPIWHFNTSRITKCLQGKSIHLFGDSTIRQWFEYLTEFLPDLVDLSVIHATLLSPRLAVDLNHNIFLTFHCHGLPVRSSAILPSSELLYIANALNHIAGGKKTVIAITIWAHFGSFPIEVYTRRLRNIRRAVVQLLDRNPQTKIVIKTANVQELGPMISLFNSDWFSYQFDKIMKKMFAGIRVYFVDAWEMTLAHYLPHKLHPDNVIVKNQLDAFLSFICPLENTP